LPFSPYYCLIGCFGHDDSENFDILQLLYDVYDIPYFTFHFDSFSIFSYVLPIDDYSRRPLKMATWVLPNECMELS